MALMMMVAVDGNVVDAPTTLPAVFLLQLKVMQQQRQQQQCLLITD